MTTVLSGARILVADDQPDVARTFCNPLGGAGAQIKHVPDGLTAWQTIQEYPFDLLLVDMKMPPDKWGGLWLLEQLAQARTHIPILVLSGEGGRAQVIKAMNLGAAGWIDKELAGQDLQPACTQLLDRADAAALQNAADQLSTPLANRFARYLRATSLDSQVRAGHLAVEAILRFAACIGLAASPPRAIPGLALSKLYRPSMGTWRDIAFALDRQRDAHPAAKRLVRALAPDTPARTAVSALVTLRNDIVHDRATAKPTDRDAVGAVLRRFAHRMTTVLDLGLGIATSMRFDGTAYALDTLLLRGTGAPQPASHYVDRAVIDGTVLLLNDADPPVSLAPMFASTTSPDGVVFCVQFDGIADDAGPDTDPAVRYAAVNGEDSEAPISLAGTWAAARQWATSA